jgi:hypothetical protein
MTIDRKEIAREQIARIAQMRRDPERAQSFDSGDPRGVQQTDGNDIDIEPGTFVRRSLARRGDQHE